MRQETRDILPYFAYGSNMSSRRLRVRVPGACFRAVGELAGYRLTFSKLGRDGSGKCTILPAEISDRVFGVVFTIPAAQKPRLDAAEGLGSHYRQIEVKVRAGDLILPAFTYVAHPERVRTGLQPFDWYKNFVCCGAVEHGLPREYIAMLSRIPEVIDPDPVRRHRNRTILASSHLR